MKHDNPQKGAKWEFEKEFKGDGEAVLSFSGSEHSDYSGAMQYRFDFPIPQARGLAPDTGLVYHSRAGDGLFGQGFSFPVSFISRDTREGVPSYDDRLDCFLINGLDRLCKEGQEKQPFGLYAMKYDITYDMIRYLPGPDGGYWEVVDKRQCRYVYGSHPASRLSDGTGRTAQWQLSYMEDPEGNQIIYEYDKDGQDGTGLPCLKNISYGNYMWEGNKEFAYRIEFQYIRREFPCRHYRFGFEVLDDRLCASIRLNHHFSGIKDGDGIMKELKLGYDLNGSAALLICAQLWGYRYNEDGSCEEACLPPVTFSYTAMEGLGGKAAELRAEEGDIPWETGKDSCYFTDLYGEGIPGILHSGREAVTYYRAADPGKYEKGRVLLEFPSELEDGAVHYVVQSLEGDGCKQIVVCDRQKAGYYKLDGKGKFHRFQEFETIPSELNADRKEWLDLEGGGRAGLLVSEHKALRYYASQGRRGFSAPRTIGMEGRAGGGDEYSDEIYGFFHITGDGRLHKVHIRDGLVEYWANCGRGVFTEAPVIMENPPHFPQRFIKDRLFLEDVTGSGSVDIIYVEGKRVYLWLNCGGSGFTDMICMEPEEEITASDHIQMYDVMGNGAAGLVVTRLDKGGRHSFYDFTGGIRPGLLAGIDNGMGRKTSIAYESSVKRRENRTLPYPFLLVSSLEEWDQISGCRDRREYGYYQGYYDREEKRLTGFGLVEQKHQVIWPEEQGTAAPSLNRSFYYTGNMEASEKEVWESRFYQEGPEGYRMPPPEQRACGREAMKILAGKVMREERYTLGEDRQIPDLITDYNYRIVEGSMDGTYRLLCTETMETVYEGKPGDGRRKHIFIPEMDQYGNPTCHLEVCYPRKRASEVLYEHGQKELFVTLRRTEYADAGPVYGSRNGLPSEEIRLRPDGIETGAGGFLTMDWVKTHVHTLTGELLGKTRYFYWAADLSECLQKGRTTPEGLLHHVREVVMEAGLYDGELKTMITRKRLEQSGIREEEGYFWRDGETLTYLKKEEYYLPSVKTILNTCEEIHYDGYFLFPALLRQHVSDGSVLERRLVMDYQALKPWTLTDWNDNQDQFLYDPVGNVLVSSSFGICKGTWQGGGNLKDYIRIPVSEVGEVLKEPKKYLEMGTRFQVIDYLSWMRYRIPVSGVELSLQNKKEDESSIIVSGAFYDGGGRTVETLTCRQDGTYLVSHAGRTGIDGLVYCTYRPCARDSMEYTAHSVLEPLEWNGYDGLSRIVKTERLAGNGEETLCRTHWYEPWEEAFYDEHDMQPSSPFYDTPLRTVYGSRGLPCGVININLAEGQKAESVTMNQYDSWGNAAAMTDCETYDRMIRGEETQPSSEARYDMLGNQIRIWSRECNRQIQMSDAAGRQICRMDGNGTVTWMEYDGLGRPLTRCVNGEEVETWLYGDQTPMTQEEKKDKNLNGSVMEHKNRAGSFQYHAYNCMGQALSETAIPSGLTGAAEDESLTGESLYDLMGKPVRITYPDQSIRTNRYDQMGRLSGIRVKKESKGFDEWIVKQILYNCQGQIEKVCFGNGITREYEYGYDLRLSRLTASHEAGGRLFDYLYTYDAVGNITAVRNLCETERYFRNEKVPAGFTWHYDALYRLIGAEGRKKVSQGGALEALEAYREAYAYDKNNNLLDLNHSSSQSFHKRIRMDSRSNRCLEYETQSAKGELFYDENGCVTCMSHLRQIEWDENQNPVRFQMEDGREQTCSYVEGAGRLRKTVILSSGGAGEIEETVYIGDYERKRIWAVKDGGYTKILERNTLLLREGQRYSAMVDSWEVDERERETKSCREAVVRIQLANQGNFSAAEYDRKGELLTWEEYYPYGGAAVLYGKNMRDLNRKQYRYMGKERDAATGFVYMGARYYIESLGRWLSTDPGGYQDGVNLYGFVHGNPVSFYDPTGRCAMPSVGLDKVSFGHGELLYGRVELREQIIYREFPQGPPSKFPTLIDQYNEHYTFNQFQVSRHFSSRNAPSWEKGLQKIGQEFGAHVKTVIDKKTPVTPEPPQDTFHRIVRNGCKQGLSFMADKKKKIYFAYIPEDSVGIDDPIVKKHYTNIELRYLYRHKDEPFVQKITFLKASNIKQADFAPAPPPWEDNREPWKEYGRAVSQRRAAKAAIPKPI